MEGESRQERWEREEKQRRHFFRAWALEEKRRRLDDLEDLIEAARQEADAAGRPVMASEHAAALNNLRWWRRAALEAEDQTATARGGKLRSARVRHEKASEAVKLAEATLVKRYGEPV